MMVRKKMDTAKNSFSLKGFLLLMTLLLLAFVTLSSGESPQLTVFFDESSYGVYVGNQLQIEANVKDNAGNNVLKVPLEWSSSDMSVVQVSKSGVVKGITPGKALVSASIKDDENNKATVEVEVRIPVKTVKIEPNTANLLIGSGEDKAQLRLKAVIEPEDAYDQSVIWKSTNEKVATVDEQGNVKALSQGKTTIIAESTCTFGKNIAKVNISVGQAITNIEINQEEAVIPVGKSVSLQANIQPANATNKTVIWSSSDEKIVAVSKNGVAKGISTGEAVITASAVDGSGVSKSCKVAVIVPIKKIVINEGKKIDVPVGYSEPLTALIEPEDASNREIIWSSSNEEIAKVDENGLVTAVSKGNVKISATARDGSGAKGIISISTKDFDMVFMDKKAQTASYFYKSGIYTIRGKVKNGCVKIPNLTKSTMVLIGKDKRSEKFSVTPVKPGTDLITVSAGKTRTKITVYVSPNAFVEDKVPPKSEKDEKAANTQTSPNNNREEGRYIISDGLYTIEIKDIKREKKQLTVFYSLTNNGDEDKKLFYVFTSTVEQRGGACSYDSELYNEAISKKYEPGTTTDFVMTYSMPVTSRNLKITTRIKDSSNKEALIIYYDPQTDVWGYEDELQKKAEEKIANDEMNSQGEITK